MITHAETRIDGARLHYVTAGAGEPVVLLHGWPQTWYCWRHVIPLLARDFLVVAPDLRGLGDSEDPRTGYDKRAVAGDVVELMTRTLGLDAFHAVGHDWGGVVAWALAAHFPGPARTLTVVDVAIPGDGGKDISQGGNRWHHAFHRVTGLPEALVAGREELYLGWFYDNYGATAEAIGPEDRAEYLRVYSRPDVLRAGFEYYRALPTDIELNEQRAREFRPSLPVQAIGGAESWGRGEEVARSLRQLVDDVEEHLVPGAGHWVPEEQPEVLAGHLTTFLRRHPLS